MFVPERRPSCAFPSSSQWCFLHHPLPRSAASTLTLYDLLGQILNGNQPIRTKILNVWMERNLAGLSPPPETSYVPLFYCAGALTSRFAVQAFICEAQVENSSEGGGSVWVYASKWDSCNEYREGNLAFICQLNFFLQGHSASSAVVERRNQWCILRTISGLSWIAIYWKIT